jgi:protein-S-isoprenylcysteine O-methyltransferase Ste14
MDLKRHAGHEREIPRAHLYHAILPIIFMITWILDSQFLHLSTFLNNFVPFIVRLPIFILIFLIAIIFIELSHRALFKDHQPPNTLLTTGILGYTRNPMYFGILLIYISFICLSISLICIVLFVIVFFFYNRMVNFEEKLLENMFGEKYLDYKSKVPKWFPIPIKK